MSVVRKRFVKMGKYALDLTVTRDDTVTRLEKVTVACGDRYPCLIMTKIQARKLAEALLLLVED